jgi:hypothetical protein
VKTARRSNRVGMEGIRSRSDRATLAFAALLTLLVPAVALATPPIEWLLEHERDVTYTGEESENVSVRIAPAIDREYTFATNYNYIYELAEIASFLADWQLDDPDSADHGGMIEAEAGDLGDVIQTDNTLEAIITWCRYGMAFGDTLTYGENVRRAWEYCWRFPAWEEEGAAGADYYRNHNCAWGVWAATAYEDAYGTNEHASYAETCATYMVEHPMPFPTSGNYKWINQFVTGWMAGNLYAYAQVVGDQALADTAVGMGNRVRNWLEQDPATNLAEERWAMSSGTAVWGVCSSVFLDDPQAGAQWVATYGPMVDTFQPWRNLPSDYGWDNAWNVAYANAHNAMYLVADDPQYAANFQALTDTLLSYDTDNDGGIPATTKDPVTEDMTWVSSYLWLMGVYGVATHLPEIDAGVLQLAASAHNPPFHAGDSAAVVCTYSNFGWTPQQAVEAHLTLTDPSGIASALGWTFDMDLGGNALVEACWPLSQSGTYYLVADASCAGDGSPENDTLALWIDVLPVVEVTGLLYSAVTSAGIPGCVTAAYVDEGGTPTPYDTTLAGADGTWTLELPVGTYHFHVAPRLPYPACEETVMVTDPPEEVITTFERVADLVIVDDDEGQDLEEYVLASCDSLSLLARTWEPPPDIPLEPSYMLEFPALPLVWLTGAATEDALTEAEQESLMSYLSGDGTLILTGQNIVEHAAAGPLFQELFPVSWGGNSSDHILDFEPGDPLGAGYDHLATAGFGSASNQTSQDILTLEEPPAGVQAYPVLRYGEEHYAAYRIEGLGGKRVLLGFGLEGVGLPAQPTGYIPPHVFLSRCLAWLAGTGGSGGDVVPVASRPSLHVSPNPARGNIRFTYACSGKTTPPAFRIYDCLGRLVTKLAPEGNAPSWHATVDCSTLPPGLYLCAAGAAPERRFVIAR